MANEWNISVIGVDLAADADAHAAGRFAGVGDGLRDATGGPAEVLALDVGRDAQIALHGAAVDLAGRGAGLHCGHVADHQIGVGVDLLERQGFNLLRAVHPQRGNLDLDLVVDARLRGRASSSWPHSGWKKCPPAARR